MTSFSSGIKKIYVLLNVLVASLVIVYCQHLSLSPIKIFAFAALLSMVAVVSLRNRYLMAITGSLYALYLIMELVIYILLCADVVRPDWQSITGHNFSATNRPYVYFDSISGYKYKPGKTVGETRVTNVRGSTLIYDHPFYINKQGYCSTQDFCLRKTSPSEKRIMVFGDSFSAGEIADTTWVDIANVLLAADSETANYKLYNFSLEASGICNWNNIFFKEIINKYDFDGVLFAVYGSNKNYFSSDLARDFIIKSSKDNESSLSFFENLPASTAEFKQYVEPELIYSCSTYSDSDITRYKNLALGNTGERKFYLSPLFPYFLGQMDEMISVLWKQYWFKKKYTSYKLAEAGLAKNFENLEQVKEYYGTRKYELFTSMLDYCRNNNKQIWLASMAAFEIGQQIPDNYHHNIYNNQLRLFARQYQANFIDGFDCMDTIDMRNHDAATRYVLNNDAHLNNAGENLYARLIYGQIKKVIEAKQ